ncbi:MAG: hypothetical protein AAF557_11105 [Pseudomonadota bacterium]
MSALHNYAAYGLHICADRPIELAAAFGPQGTPDIQFDLRGCQYTADPDLPDEPRSGFNRMDDGSGAMMWFTGSGRLDFRINAAADRVSVSGYQTNSHEMSLLLLGQVFGVVLRMRRILSLHACALNLDGCAVAVLGASGVGKSTLAAHLASNGAPVLADDVTAILESGDGHMVQPGFPAMKFWPDTLKLSNVAADAQDRVFNFTDKRVLPLRTGGQSSEWQFQPTPLPMRGIFVLQGRRADLSYPIAEKLDPIAAVPVLMANRSSLMCALGPKVDGQELKSMARLAGAVPVWSITCPDDVGNLAASVDLLHRCLDGCKTGTAA